MKLEQIVYALEIFKAGSFSKAAQNLYISQPNLSFSIKKLEQELGFNIFERGYAGISITNKGAEFLKYAVSIHRNIEQINTINTKIDDINTIELNISTQLHSTAMVAILELMKKYTDSRTRFNINQGSFFQVLDNVYNRYSDIGLIHVSDYQIDLWNKILTSKGLEFNFITDATLCACVSSNSPLYNYNYIDNINNILDNTLILYNADDKDCLYLYERTQLKLDEFKHVISVSEWEEISKLLISKDCLFLGTDVNIKNILNIDNLYLQYKSIPIKPIKKLKFGWVKLSSLKMTSIQQEFINILQKQII